MTVCTLFTDTFLFMWSYILDAYKQAVTYAFQTVSPSVSSQMDMDFDMANGQYLGSFSQHDDPIEIHHWAMAPCEESHTLALLQIPHDILVEEVNEDTVLGWEIVSVTVPTIVMVEEPSHDSEGKSDPSTNFTRIIFYHPRGNISGSLKGFSTRRFIRRKWKATR